MRIPTLVAAAVVLLVACGGDDASSGSGGATASATGAGTPTSSGTRSTSATGSGGEDGEGGDSSGSAPTSASTLSGGSGGAGGEGGSEGPDALRSFSYGINLGWQPDQPDPGGMALLANQAGVNSSRPKFSVDFLDTWGIGVELPKLEAAAAEGLHDHVGFLIGSSVGKTTSPDGTNLEHHIPTNLHEPIWNDDGTVNEDNHWAVFVRDVVTTYKDHVKIWEVWNEPDWIADWQHSQTWDTEPPTAEQLVRFGGDIHDYVRLLRISTEVAKSVDPDAKIALGGVGYPSFLAAVLRYTDSPDGGVVDADHPSTGDAYFDVVSYHFYPVFSSEQMSASDRGVDGFIGSKTEMQGVLDAAGAGDKTWVVTENGAPHVPFEVGGGEEFARNFLLKSMVVAQVENIRSVQWFCMADEAEQTSEFSRMGLYDALSGQTRETATRTGLGSAYRTLGALHDAKLDPVETAALDLEATGARGGAFRFDDGRKAYVLWARADTGEQATATTTIQVDGEVTVGEWNTGETGATTTLTASGGQLVVDLVGSPRIFLEQ